MTTATEQAQAIGTTHGKNAASWVFDGNSSDDTYRRILRGIDAGDPEVMDSLRTPSLSGEFGDDYSEEQLAKDVLDDNECSECGHSFTNPQESCECCAGDLSTGPGDHTELMSKLAGAYNDAASTAFWHEVERLAHGHLG